MEKYICHGFNKEVQQKTLRSLQKFINIGTKTQLIELITAYMPKSYYP